MADAVNWFNNVKDYFQSQATASAQKTPYQQNVSQPVQQSAPTTREALGQIFRATQQDQTYGRQLQDQFKALQSDRGSIYFAPYLQSTNKAINELNNLGISGVNRNWYDNTAFMDNYLVFNGQTNTPSAPTKKSSEMERIAYQRYQYGKSLQQTDDALRECDALNEEINFLANWGDRNYSDDEIMDYLYANGGADFQKKYPTLAKMDSSLEPGQALMEFNEAIPYSKDWVYGRIWAARNNGGTGNDYRDMAMSALGEGNQWQENADIAGRLKWGTDTYAPYTVSSTTDDVCMYLGVPSYDRQYLMDHQPDMNDKTSVDMWNKGMEAVQFTETAQEEAAKLNERLNTKLQTAESVEEVMKWLDNRLASGEYNSLAKLDKSTDKINSLIDTSAPIDFSRNVIRKMAEEAVAKNSQKKNGGQTIEDNGIGSVSEQEAEAIKAGDKNVKEASDLINATDSEQNTFTNTPSSWFDRVYNMIGMANPVTLLKNNEQSIASSFVSNMIPIEAKYAENQKAKQQLDVVNKELEQLAPRKEAVEAIGDITPEQYANLMTIPNDENWAYYENILSNPQRAEFDDYQRELYDNALTYLYQRVHAGDPSIYGFSDIEVIRENALKWFDVLQNHSDVEPLTAEELDRYEKLTAAKAELEGTIEQTSGAEQAISLQNFVWNARIAAYEQAGIDPTGLQTAKAVSGAMEFFSTYDPTEWNPDSYYDSMQKSMGEGATAGQVLDATKDYTNAAKENIETAKWLLEYAEENGIEIPDDYRNNIERYIAKNQRTLDDYVYYSLRGRDDFDEMAAKGEQIAKESGFEDFLTKTPVPGTNNALFDEMSEDERKTAYYLIANPDALYSVEYEGYVSDVIRDAEGFSQGEGRGFNEAGNYVSNHLADDTYGVLPTRYRETVEKNAQAEVDSGFLGALWGNVKAIASAPLEAIMGGMYALDKVISGDEANPNNVMLSFGHYSTAINQRTSENIQNSEFMKENPILRDIAMGAYEIVYNRGRSMANMYFGSPEIGGRFGSILSEIVGAVPMATGAAAMAIAEAKEKGADDGTAFLIGGVTMMMESFTEGLTRSNIKEAFAGGANGDVAQFAKDRAVEWLTQSGFEEAFGETLTDYVEGYIDEHLMDINSEHQARVDQYIADNKLNPDNPVDVEEAEAAARADELAGLVHTAVISYLSPGMDVAIASAKEGIADFHNIRVATRNMQKSGMDVSMSDVRKQYKEWKQAEIDRANAPKQTEQAQAEQTTEQVQTAQAEAENPNFSVEDVDADALFAQQNNEAVEQTAGVVAPSKTPSTADQAFLADLSKLDAVQNSDTSTQAAAIGALFGSTDNPVYNDFAKAAAANITNLFGSMQNAVEQVKNIITGAHIQHISHEAVKSALQTAVLSASSMANEVANSEEFKNASPMEQATMLAETVEADQANETVQAETAKSVHENRISAAEGELIRNGALDSIKNLKANMEKAEQNVRMAEESLSEKQGEVQAKSEALTAANEAFVQDPSADNQHMVDRAANELDKASAVEQEYEQHLDNVNRANADAKSRYEAEQEAAMRNIRQQAETIVAQQDQQRAERDAQIAEQRRLAQEQAAQAQAEEDQRSGKAAEDQTRSLAEDWANLQHLEGEERENFIDRVMNIQEQRKLGKIDMTGKLNNAEGYLAIQAFARKTGLNFQLSDTLPAGTRGMYQNGTVYLNSDLVKSGKMTIGQALVEASLHEIPHAMEQTKNYQTYRNVVLGSLFGVKGNQTAQQLYKSNAQFRAAVDQKIADYSGLQNLTVEGAEKEIVADFARLHLADKEVVQRFMDAGMGGKMRNTLHNINQALKNFFGGLKGEDRTQAEYLRRAERAFQKAMNELAKTAVHPEGGQFSVAQIAQATGMTFDEETLKLYDANGNEVDGVTNKITPEMVDQTPVGMLINNGLTGEAQQKAREMMAGLMNMVARYKDSNLVWEIGATTLSSTFSALKSNSDPQYKTTVDFGTVCAKTQAIIDVMSKVMLDRVKEGKTGGLSREDIMKVYNEVNKAGLSVPCPVCYVFSRWMGVPSLLGQMSQYQKDYVVQNEDGSINMKATQKVVDDYIKSAEAKYGDAKAINSAKTKFQNKLAKLEEKRMDLEGSLYDKTLTAEQKDKIRGQIKDVLHQMTEIDKQLGEVNAYNWITQALCKKEGDRFVVDSKFKLTPDEILFDLNRTGEFAGYEKNWRYRNTRGAGMGKAIMPYSGETIGDILYGVKKNGRQIKNPWLNMDAKAAGRQLRDARARAIKQNLVGGQRLQSTSDFRPEWGLDYIMSFLELQAAGSKVQMYTKVAEAVDFFASVGADVNLSIMGQGQGWHVDENGNKVLDFSSITGMDYETAKALKDKYNNVQMILVGMNDTHIRLAMANSDIDFIIPWHSSGNSKDVLAGLIKSVGEKLDSSVDYTTTQTDMVKGTVKTYRDENNKTVEYTVPGKQTESEKALWDARMKLLTKGGNALTQAERETLLSNPITSELYRRFTEKGYDDECYGVKLSKDQANQIFPYEYWDTSLTKDKADENGKRFVEYCEAMGIVPRFSQFKDDPGYWKLLIDRPMYNNDGTYHQQQIIDVTNANIGELNEDGKLTGSDLPQQAQAKYAPKDPRNANYAKYTKAEQDAVENAKAALEEQYDDGTEGQYSVYGDMTDADIEQALAANDFEDRRNAIYITDGRMKDTGETVDFINLILDGKKTGETRTHNTLSTNQWLGIAKDGFVYGRVKLGKPYKITKESPEYKTSFIEGVESANGKNDYDIPDNGFKWYYPIEAVEDFRDNPQPILRNGNYGRYSTAGDMTDADIEQRLADAGVIPRAEEQQGPVQFPVRDHYKEKLSTRENPMVFKDSIRNHVLNAGENGEFNYNLYDISEGTNPTRTIITFTDTPGEHIQETLSKLGMRPVDVRKDNGKSENRIWATRDGTTIPMNDVENAVGGSDTEFRNNNVSNESDKTISISKKLADTLNSFGWTIMDNSEYDGDGSYRYSYDIYDGNGNKIGTKYGSGIMFDSAGYGKNLFDSGMLKGGTYRGSVWTPTENTNVRNHAVPPTGNNTTPAAPMMQNPNTGLRQFGIGMGQQENVLHANVRSWLAANDEYTKDTNRAQLDRAIGWIAGHATESDQSGFYGAMREAESPDFNPMSADGQARMVALMALAATMPNENESIEAQKRLANLFNIQGTTAGQTLQARKMFRLMTPMGRQAVLLKLRDQINQDYAKKGNNTRVELSDWVLKAAAAAKTEEDFQKVRSAAAQELAEQMPANWKEKMQSLRMLAMLANTRTHIRNFLGNAMFIPAVSLKNKIGAGLEATFVKDGERTKNFGISSKEVRAFARADAEKMESVLRGESKYNEGNEVQKERQIFKSKLLQGISEVNSKFLEGEDWFFLKGHYRRALGSYMMANNLTEADMTGKTLDNARAYAIAEAQKATYRDANELAKWLNNVKNPAARFVVNAILPFKKTPANILKRGVEYSPVSIIKALTTDAKHLKEWQAYQRGELAALPEKAISPAQYIDRLSSGLSGTMIMALGGLLNALGVVKAGLDDDDDEFDKMNGSQEYSLEIFGVSFTMDWAAPVCMPFFVGATIMDEAKKAAADNGEGVGIGKILDSMLGITEPVFNLSMLDGVNSLLNTNQYSDGNNITQIGEKIVTNYFTSYVPSAFGALARSIDTTRRRNYVESGADLSVFRSALEQVENKIPWLSTTNIPYRDVWGNAEVSSPAEAIIENWISPGYGNALKNDPVNNELKRLYDATKNPNMIPKTAGKTVSINGNSVKLNAEQYDQYVVDRGQTAYQTIRDLMESPVWQVCDDNTRSMMVTDAWTYANQIARHNLDPNGKLDSWVANAQYNGNFVDVVVDRAAETNRKDYIAGYGQNLAEAREAGDKETYDLCMTALDEAGATSAEIRSPVRDYFKPLYQQAFEANDTTTMDSIEDMLIDIGIGFKIDDIRGWVPSEDDDDEQKNNTRWLNMKNNSGSRINPSNLMASGARSDIRPSRPMPSRPASEANWGQYMDDLDEYWANYDFDRYDPVEQNYDGTIDINNRKVVHNADGSISTDLSFSFLDENPDSPNYGKEVLIPAIVNGKEVSQRDAIQHYYDTNEYFGVFDNWQDADEYSIMLHNRGDWYYNR